MKPSEANAQLEHCDRVLVVSGFLLVLIGSMLVGAAFLAPVFPMMGLPYVEPATGIVIGFCGFLLMFLGTTDGSSASPRVHVHK